MTPPADPENQPLAERDLEAVVQILWHDDPSASLVYYRQRVTKNAEMFSGLFQELCGYNAGAAAMREVIIKAIKAGKREANVRLDPSKYRSLSAWFDAQRIAYIRALPIPPDPTTALVEEVKRLKADLHEAQTFLVEANGECRACFQVAQRMAMIDETEALANFRGMAYTLKKSLDRQHAPSNKARAALGAS